MKRKSDTIKFCINHGADSNFWFLQINPDYPVDSSKVIDNFFGINGIRFNELLIHVHIKKEANLSIKERELLETFFNNVATSNIINSSLLWNSLFIQNEISVFYPENQRIKDYKLGKNVLSLSNSMLAFVEEKSRDELLITLYHFWFTSKRGECNWNNLKKIFLNSFESNSFETLNNFIIQNIFKNNDFKTSSKNNEFSKIKDYRNNLLAHIDGNAYKLKREFKDNSLFMLSNIIKNLCQYVNLFFSDNRFNSAMSVVPNLYLFSGGCIKGTYTTISWKTENKFYYFVIETWKKPFRMF